MAGEPAQQGAQIFAAAFAEITQQHVELRRRQCRGGGEAGVVAVFAGQHGERDAALARHADSRSMPYFHQSRPPSSRTTITLACAPTRSIHRSTDIGWRRSRKCARRTLGSAARSACQAAARPARSLSANDSTTMSPGGWPRSTASTISSRLVELVVSRCIAGSALFAQPGERARHRGAVEAFQPDHHEPAFARLGGGPRPVVLMLTRGPTACTMRRIGLPATAAKPLTRSTSNARPAPATRCGKRGGIGDFADRHDEGIEIVVIVLCLVVVMGAAVGDVVLGADAEPEQQRLVDLAVGGGDHFDAARQHVGDRRQRLRIPAVVDEIALVEHDEIGAGDLVLEHLLDRIVMVERSVGGALRAERVEIGGDAAVGERRAVDHDHDAVDGDAALDRRPMERLHQRLRQRQAGGLDDDVLDAFARQNGVERRHELVGDGAAQAAIGEFDDVLLRAGVIAAAFENFAVDADVAELVDDDGEAAALRVGDARGGSASSCRRRESR